MAYDAPAAEPVKNVLKQRIATQLSTCATCVRQYHRLVCEKRAELEAEWDEDTVNQFFLRVNFFNNDRIGNGLDYVRNLLERLPAESRNSKNVGPEALFAFLEAMFSSVFSQNEALLARHFDKPFELITGVKRLKPQAYPPAMTSFLFSAHETRRQWAEANWKRFKRGPTQNEFDWTMREPLMAATSRMTMSNLDPVFVPNFWKGIDIIARNVDDHIIAHSVRGMDGPNIFKLSLEHLHLRLEKPAFLYLLSATAAFLQKAPKAYWDSMGTIGAQTVIEQIFSSPNMPKLVTEDDSDSLQEALLLVKPLVDSLPLDKQPAACRSLMQNLFNTYKNPSHSRVIRQLCFNTAIGALLESLTVVVQACYLDQFLDPACIGEMFQILDNYASEILTVTKHLPNQTQAVSTPLLVIQKAVELDVALVAVAHRIISAEKPLLTHHFKHSGQIWKVLSPVIKASRTFAISTRTLIGSSGLLKIERFPETKTRKLNPDSCSYNDALDSTMSHVKHTIDAIDSWEPRHIMSIFKTSELASGFVSTLFMDSEVRSLAIGVLQTMTDQDSTRDALHASLKSCYTTLISSLGLAISRVSSGRQYSAHSAAIRISTDIIDSLFSSQDGVLRSKDLDGEQCDATSSLWENLWQMLTVIFQTTESWSKKGFSKADLENFCRDVMQFAESLYDYYSVLVSALCSADADVEETRECTNKLLIHPNRTMSTMVGWLRLNDDYLISKIIAVFSKLLSKLKDAHLRVSVDVESFVGDICRGKIRNKLTKAQIASLMQVVESHTEKQLFDDLRVKAEVKDEQRHKQSSISTWVGPGVKDQSLADRTSNAAKEFTKASSTFKDLNAQFQKPIVRTIPKPAAKADGAEFIKKRNAEREAEKQRKAAEIEKRREAAERLKAEREANIMVDKSETSESDDEGEDLDMDKVLFGVKSAGHALGRSARKDVKIRDIKDLPKGPVKIKKQVRTARDIRARIAPDLSPLHRTVLSWEYFHHGDIPPGSEDNVYTKAQAHYKTPLDYKHVFQPLLFLEAWQGFVKAREDNSFRAFEIKVASRSAVDTFVEISTVMSLKENREVSEGDIVLLSLSPSPLSAKDASHCLARVHKITKKKKELEILYRAVQGTRMVREVNPDQLIYAVKIQSLTPLEREYAVLQSLQFYDLLDYILEGKPSELLSYNDKSLDSLMNIYNLNKAQCKAVKSAMDNDAFTLVQGPPGSGKTKTILAIVGALLSQALGRSASNGTTQETKKVLVCAPSNAAVDELVMRLKQGVKTISGQEHRINIIRIGRSDAVNAAVQDVTMEELVNARLCGSGNQDKQRAQTQDLMAKHKDVSEKLREARARLDADATEQNQQEVDSFRKQKAALGSQIDGAKASENNFMRQNELERKQAQKALIDQAHVICATLSGSGHEMFQSLGTDFETVIVDEAAQCVELSALIPLKYGCTKCILVGDPKQLPPTVLSKEASKFSYEKSMFVRMQENQPDNVHLLDTQYRMHPEISRFPSAAFYDGRLVDGPDLDKQRIRPWHCSSLLGPYSFFDVQGQHQTATRGYSLINMAEVNIAMKLYERLTVDFSDSFDFGGKIGIITPYKSQLAELKKQFSHRYGSRITSIVEFNTTDAFQGRESEVIIFSCVRASPAGNIGFLQDIRRMNVGLTRARSSLWVLGNSDSLKKGEYWKMMIDDAVSREKFHRGTYVKQLDIPTSSSLRAQWIKSNPLSRGIEVMPQSSNKEHALSHSKTTDYVVTSASLVISSRSGSVASTTISEPQDIEMTDAPDLKTERETSISRQSDDNLKQKTPSSSAAYKDSHLVRAPGKVPTKVVKRGPANPLLPRAKKPKA